MSTTKPHVHKTAVPVNYMSSELDNMATPGNVSCPTELNGNSNRQTVADEVIPSVPHSPPKQQQQPVVSNPSPPANHSKAPVMPSPLAGGGTPPKVAARSFNNTDTRMTSSTASLDATDYSGWGEWDVAHQQTLEGEQGYVLLSRTPLPTGLVRLSWTVTGAALSGIVPSSDIAKPMASPNLLASSAKDPKAAVKFVMERDSGVLRHEGSSTSVLCGAMDPDAHFHIIATYTDRDHPPVLQMCEAPERSNSPTSTLMRKLTAANAELSRQANAARKVLAEMRSAKSTAAKPKLPSGAKKPAAPPPPPGSPGPRRESTLTHESLMKQLRVLRNENEELRRLEENPSKLKEYQETLKARDDELRMEQKRKRDLLSIQRGNDKVLLRGDNSGDVSTRERTTQETEIKRLEQALVRLEDEVSRGKKFIEGHAKTVAELEANPALQHERDARDIAKLQQQDEALDRELENLQKAVAVLEHSQKSESVRHERLNAGGAEAVSYLKSEIERVEREIKKRMDIIRGNTGAESGMPLASSPTRRGDTSPSKKPSRAGKAKSALSSKRKDDDGGTKLPPLTPPSSSSSPSGGSQTKSQPPPVKQSLSSFLTEAPEDPKDPPTRPSPSPPAEPHKKESRKVVETPSSLATSGSKEKGAKIEKKEDKQRLDIVGDERVEFDAIFAERSKFHEGLLAKASELDPDTCARMLDARRAVEDSASLALSDAYAAALEDQTGSVLLFNVESLEIKALAAVRQRYHRQWQAFCRERTLDEVKGNRAELQDLRDANRSPISDGSGTNSPGTASIPKGRRIR
eukprot:PhM_4_TR234/c0_g1_i1/m.81376